MHTNKYLEKIAEYDWNNIPKDMGVGYGIAGAISPAIGVYMGLRDSNERIQRLKADAGYRLGLQSHLDEVDTILSGNRKVLKVLPAIMASSGAIVGGAGYMAGRSIRDRALQKSAAYGREDDPERLRRDSGLIFGVAGTAIGGLMTSQQLEAQRNAASLSRNIALGSLPGDISRVETVDIPKLQQAHATAVEEAAKGATWRKAQRFLDHDVTVAKAKLDDAITNKETLKVQMNQKMSSQDFKRIEKELAKVNSKSYAAKTRAIGALKLGIPSFVVGSGAGMVFDAWRGDMNKKAEHHQDDVATTSLINKITNPISWAAKIDLAGNTSTRVAALALNTLAREVSKSDEHHNIPGTIQYRV